MKLLISGGGTGGHLFPAIAVAQEFLSRRESNKVLFVGTKKGIEARVLPKLGLPHQFISISGFSGKTWVEKIKTLFLIPYSLVQSFFIILQFKPDIVLGVGGYASFSVMAAAFFLRKKRSILEQNLEPGLVNHILSYIVQKIFVSFEESNQYFPESKVIVTGNPIRQFKRSEPISHEKFTIFIFGGSQGAHSINRALGEALSYLEPLKEKIHLIHQTGKKDLNWVSSQYSKKGWRAEIHEFIDDMDHIFAKSDFIICRAGASSLAELSFLAKACLLIPFPYAVHNHQEYNARLLEKREAVRVLLDWRLNGFSLAKEIQYAYEHPQELEKMQKNIKEFSYPHAAKNIVDELYKYDNLK